ncbi:MAG: DUF2490 domain-containing protein, partial [Bacteroidales bacterium]|nr:DUF2490 domain-containing protein [Bacteroidales bacterium]
MMTSTSMGLSAQTDVDLDPEFGGRLALSIDKKIVKGLHVSLEEEVRFDDNFSEFNRFHTTLSVTYKPISFLKLGLGYALINPYNNNVFKSARHRFYFDAMGTYRFGHWALSLKERLQITHRTGEFNQYQNPANALMLKSRLQLKYKGIRKLTPYAYVELRHYLNAPTIVANYDGTNYLTDDGSVKGDAGWFLDGFNSIRMNRVRGSLGLDYALDKHSTFSFSFLADFVSDKEV